MRLMTRPCRADLSAARQGQAQTLRLYDMRTRCVQRRPIATTYDVILLEGAYGPQHLVNDFPFSGVVYLEESFRGDCGDVCAGMFAIAIAPPATWSVRCCGRCCLGNASSSRPLKRNASVVIRDQNKGLGQVLDLLGSPVLARSDWGGRCLGWHGTSCSTPLTSGQFLSD